MARSWITWRLLNTEIIHHTTAFTSLYSGDDGVSCDGPALSSPQYLRHPAPNAQLLCVYDSGPSHTGNSTWCEFDMHLFEMCLGHLPRLHTHHLSHPFYSEDQHLLTQKQWWNWAQMKVSIRYHCLNSYKLVAESLLTSWVMEVCATVSLSMNRNRVALVFVGFDIAQWGQYLYISFKPFASISKLSHARAWGKTCTRLYCIHVMGLEVTRLGILRGKDRWPLVSGCCSHT